MPPRKSRRARRKGGSLAGRRMPPSLDNLHFIDRVPLPAHRLEPVPALVTFRIISIDGGTVKMEIEYAGRVKPVTVAPDVELFSAAGIPHFEDDYGWGAAFVTEIINEGDVFLAKFDVGGIVFWLKAGQNFALRGEATRPWRAIPRYEELAILIGDKQEICRTDEGDIVNHLALIDVIECNDNGATVSVEGITFPVEVGTGFVILSPAEDDAEDGAEPPPLPIFVATHFGGRGVRLYIGGLLSDSPAFCARPFEDARDKIPLEHGTQGCISSREGPLAQTA